MITLYVDGGTRGSVICLTDLNTHKTIVKKRKGAPTNNDLEYLAVIYGIVYAKKHYPRDRVLIKSDSMLVVKQVNGSWAVKSASLAILCHKTTRLLKGTRIKLKWVPREVNLAGIHLEEMKDML